jgi:hypothetical protein
MLMRTCRGSAISRIILRDDGMKGGEKREPTFGEPALGRLHAACIEAERGELVRDLSFLRFAHPDYGITVYFLVPLRIGACIVVAVAVVSAGALHWGCVVFDLMQSVLLLL